MTIAIRTSQSDLFWFDAILQLSKSYQNTITKHPVESGRKVSDHTVRENTQFSFSGVLTDADFNMDRPQIRLGNYTGDELAEEVKYKQFVNNTPVTVSPTIEFGAAPLAGLLPASVTQFLGNNTPTVTLTERELAKPAEAVGRALEAIRDNAELFELIEYKHDGTYRIFENCQITSLTFTTEPDSGDALYPQITAEQVRYTDSKKTTLPASMRTKAAKKTSLGKQATTATDTSKNPNVAERDMSASKQTAKDLAAKAAVQRGKAQQ